MELSLHMYITLKSDKKDVSSIRLHIQTGNGH